MLPIYCSECGKECDIYLFPEKNLLKVEYFCPECNRKCAVIYMCPKCRAVLTRDYEKCPKCNPEQETEKVIRIENK